MKDYVTPAMILGIKKALLTLSEVVYSRQVADNHRHPVLTIFEIKEILEKLAKDEEDI